MGIEQNSRPIVTREKDGALVVFADKTMLLAHQLASRLHGSPEAIADIQAMFETARLPDFPSANGQEDFQAIYADPNQVLLRDEQDVVRVVPSDFIIARTIEKTVNGPPEAIQAIIKPLEPKRIKDALVKGQTFPFGQGIVLAQPKDPRATALAVAQSSKVQAFTEKARTSNKTYTYREGCIPGFLKFLFSGGRQHPIDATHSSADPETIIYM